MRLLMCGLVCVLACKQKPADENGATPGQSGAMGASGGMGSAMGTKMMDAAAAEIDAAPAARAKTLDEMAKRYEECFRFRNDKRWDELASCLAPGAKYEAVGTSAPDAGFFTASGPATTDELQILLVTPGTMIALVAVTDKHPYYTARVVAFEAGGKLTGVREFFDATSKPPPAGGVAQKESLTAKADDVEQANFKAAQALLALTKSDKIGEAFADDYTETADGVVLAKAAAVKRIAARAQPLTVVATWAAGNYVAAEVKAGDQPGFVIVRFADGKAKQAWSFRIK